MSKRTRKPKRTEQLARVEALIEQARGAGLVEIDREVAPFVAPDDPRVAERVPGGAGWARYTLRLDDGTLVLEGGARRVWFVDPERARVMIRDAAARAVEQAVTLHRMLSLYVRSTQGGAGRTAVESAIGVDPQLVARLVARIEDRAEVEPQRIVQPDLVAALRALVESEETVKRLARDHTLPADVLETVALRPERRDPALDVDAELASRLNRGEVVLDETVVRAIRPVEVAPSALIPGGERWWAFAARLPDGSLHLEGGSRRLRVTSSDGARALVEARVEEVIGTADLRTLLYHRIRVETGKNAGPLYDALRRDEAALARLDAHIRSLAQGADVDPPLTGSALRALALAGVDEADIRRLGRVRELPPQQLERVRERQTLAVASPAAERLDAMLRDRIDRGWVELRDDTVPYLQPDDPQVEERLPAGAAPWAQHVVVLRDGSIHMEGGRTRVRVCAPDEAHKLTERRATEILSETDLHALLALAARVRAAPMQPGVYLYLGDPRRWAALLHRIRVVASDPALCGRVRRRLDQDLLEEAGVDAETRRSLAGERGPSVEAVREGARRVKEARERARGSRLSDLIVERSEAGWVELREDVVPFVSPDSPEVVEVFPPSAAPGVRFAALLTDGSIQLEGGRTRVRLVPPGTVEDRLKSRYLALLAETDLHRLLEVAGRSGRGPAPSSLAGWVRARDERWQALLARIRERAADPAWSGRIGRKDHLAVLELAGVPAEQIAELGGKLAWWVPGEATSKAVRVEPPADRLAELLTRRSREGWVELHEDAVPFLADDDPRVAERLPARATPWTRHIAVLRDGSIHLEGGRQRVRVCSPAIAAKLLDEAARALLGTSDLPTLLETAARCRQHPPAFSVHARIARDRRMIDQLHRRIQTLADDPVWDGRIHKRAWHEVLEAVGTGPMRRLFLQGALHHMGADEARPAMEAARRARGAARLAEILDDRRRRGWVELGTGAVPYVDATDERVRELFHDPDAHHRFAAVLEDGTVIHEGGTTRFWLVPPEQAPGILGEQARRTIREATAYGLIELLLAAERSDPDRHPLGRLLSSRDELRAAAIDRLRAVLRERPVRVTRPEHRALLARLGLGDAGRAAGD